MNKKGFPVLLQVHQEFILKLAHLDPYLLIEVKAVFLQRELNYKNVFSKTVNQMICTTILLI